MVLHKLFYSLLQRRKQGQSDEQLAGGPASSQSQVWGSKSWFLSPGEVLLEGAASPFLFESTDGVLGCQLRTWSGPSAWHAIGPKYRFIE